MEPPRTPVRLKGCFDREKERESSLLAVGLAAALRGSEAGRCPPGQSGRGTARGPLETAALLEPASFKYAPDRADR